MTLLEAENLEARHGLLQAVRGISFAVAERQVLAMVGANGAGKSTLLRTIAGAHKAAGGTVTFDGADITHLPAHARVRHGIALVPEGRRLFADLTVEENLRVAAGRARPGPWNLGTVLDAFPALAPLRARRAASLSGGQQQLTAIARAVVTNPRLLVVDEVSLGLSPVAVDGVYDCLGVLRAAGTTLILVEQDLRRALTAADHVLCLLEGRVALSAPTADVTREQVTAAYFGLHRAELP
ncbi:ABC transporter ATP-binding protein [Dactylosporangium sp. AC04546]|uniref:ABC transporter ATP-binding protein n=1 Tax=Dactylosporangium sp. AC04546 TaxID=2862460 RepID=UPI001EE03D8D|nr:ABC transporter ATP-binding protein [Dactylosporangium sp. AC04546]WVK79206.1 ABC transporter ATP-binding protein [Dactylosporangium sp. AC04546]